MSRKLSLRRELFFKNIDLLLHSNSLQTVEEEYGQDEEQNQVSHSGSRNDPKFSDRQIWANSVDPVRLRLHCLPFLFHLLEALLCGKAKKKICVFQVFRP